VAEGSALEEAHRRRIVGYLTMRMPMPVDVVFTDNRSTMISFRRRGGRIAVRLHRIFRHADNVVLDHLSRYMVAPTRADSAALDHFIDAHKAEIDRRPRRRARALATKGRFHDLRATLHRVCHTYFKGDIDVKIGWGSPPKRRTKTRRRRTISRALATYNYDTRTIRVSPVLDTPNVPAYVLEWVVYHELLHHVLPVKKINGKHRYHTSQFRLYERAFRQYEAAKRWEEQHLKELLF
jgi:hypothetical protein